jgi:biotin/methionine sulfoxide reductase
MPMNDTTKLVPNHSHWGAFLAEVKDGRFVGVRPFPRDPDPSPLIEAMPAAVHSPTRIAVPMVREGFLAHGPGHGEGRGREPFVPVPWERALDLVAGELERVRGSFGHEAIMGGSQGWGSAGIFHDARTQVRRFMSAFGGFVDQTSNYSFGAALTFLPHVLGSAQAVSGPLTSWSSIARHTRLLVLFGGANPKNLQVTKGGCGEHSAQGAMAELARAGVEVVNVSPIRDDGPTAAAATWLPIRPNTDTAMLLALVYTLVAEGLHDESFLARHCVGFERVLPYLMGETDGQAKDAAWAAVITGVPADTIRSLARRMAVARTMVSASWSIQRADHGEQPYWAVILLAAALGQIGLPGGGFGFGYGSTSGIAEPPLAFGPPAMEVLANPLARAIPAARIADCLLDPGGTYDFNGKQGTYPDIRLVYWAGGNPFHHHQDLNRLRRAWQRPQTIIVHEPWWTATARHADIVLPATTTLERNDIGAAQRDRYVLSMQQAIAPVGEARSDFAIFTDLARRLRCEAAYAQGRDEMGWLRHLYDRWRERVRTNQVAIPDFDGFWRDGFLEIPRRADEYVLFSDFRADPDQHRLATPSGRIELYSDRIAGFGYDDCPPHPTWLEPSEWLGAAAARTFPLHLVSSQPRDRLHSQMDCGPVSRKGKVAGREAVAINPQDAAVRGIAEGDVVRVFNRRGACLAGATLTDAVSRGVARLACGAWYDPDGDSENAVCAHGNANVLTRDHGTSKLGQGPSSATVLVEIERCSEPPPPVRAFVPPPMAEAATSR